MAASSKVKRTWKYVWKRQQKIYFHRPYISKLSSKHSDEFPVGQKKLLQKE